MDSNGDGQTYTFANGGAASWNPAFRPNSNRSPLPGMNGEILGIKSQTAPTSSNTIGTAEEYTRSKEDVHYPQPVVEQHAIAETADVDFFDRNDSTAETTSTIPSITQESTTKDEDASDLNIEGDGDGDRGVSANHTLSEDRGAPAVSSDTPAEPWPESVGQEPLEDIASRYTEDSDVPQPKPTAPYEPQGQSTFLADAVAEDPQMPLVAADAEESTIDWGNATDNFLGDEPAGLSSGVDAAEDPQMPLVAADVEESTIDWGNTTDDFLGDEPAGLSSGVDAAVVDHAISSDDAHAGIHSSELEPQINTSSAVGEQLPLEQNMASDSHEQTTDFFGTLADEKLEGKTQPEDDFFGQDQTKSTGADDFFSSDITQDSGADFFAQPKMDTGILKETSEPQPQKPEDETKALWDETLGNDDFLEENGESGFFLDEDDEGFLEDVTEGSALPADATQPITSQPATPFTDGLGITGNRYAPQDAQQQPPQQPQAPNNLYTPQAPNFTDLSSKAPASQPSIAQSQTAPQPSYGAVYGQTYQPPPALPSQPAAAVSFVDKSRGGYASPFDLPEDIPVRRRRPMASPAPPAGVHPTAPPPRTSSIGTSSMPAPPAMDQPSNLPPPGFPTPPSSSSAQFPPRTSTTQDRPASSASAGKTSFFEDLPVVSRPRYSPRPPQSSSPYQMQPGNAAQGSLPTAPPQNMPPTAPPQNMVQPMAPPPPPSSTMDFTAQLQRPEMASPYADLDSSQPRAPPHVPQTTRYSPTSTAPAPKRYSPTPPVPALQPGGLAPASAPPVPQTAQNRYVSAPRSVTQFAPRTSSPLAHHSAAPEVQTQHTQEPLRPLPANHTASFPVRSDAPVTQAPPFAPPRRSLTQSPGSTMKGPKPAPVTTERPASALEPLSPTFAEKPPSMHLGRRRGFTLHEDFIEPQDDRVADPLQRWKGYPVFAWGMGGTCVSSFPVQIPRYGAGHATPMIKCALGEVKTKHVEDVLPLPDRLAKFPGPLKKNKKKEVLAWLKAGTDAMDNEMRSMGVEMQLGADGITKMNEKILLWRLLGLLVEHDGVLEGTPAVEQATRKLFTTENVSTADVATPYGMRPESSEAPRSGPVLAESADSKALSTLRKFLATGERDKAVWYAVDQRLWGHAMIISSALSRDLWKQVVQEFVRKEVQKAGPGNEALGALYETFAGNWDESVDELVPMSARAGFQMVSKSESTGATRNRLAGLDKWQETLLLILNNRTQGDPQALLGLGKLLIGYGRVEAAHICFLFAKSLTYIGGSDDPRAQLTLVGSDAHVHEASFGHDLESIMLTEVYEFSLSLTPQAQTLPHLQAYKLHHALVLAESGHRNEAQQYCDAITAIISSKTKPSPYYHHTLISVLDDLSKRLSEAPKEASSSWISRPNMDKVSGSLWEKVANFVAGDENDGASTGSGGKNEVGPFARIAGDTPAVSRSASHTDLYGAAYGNNGAPLQPSTSFNAKYAPGNATARSSMESAKGQYRPHSAAPFQAARTSAESPPGPYMPRAGSESPTMHHHLPGQSQQTSSYAPVSAPSQTNGTSYRPQSSGYRPQSSGYTPQTYAPSPPVETSVAEDLSVQPPTLQQARSFESHAYVPSVVLEEPTTAASFEGPPSRVELSGPPTLDLQEDVEGPAETFGGGYEPPSYEPPTSSYEPPTYQPYEPEPETQKEEVEEKAKPKKKGVMYADEEDDDDLARRAAELKNQQRSQADDQADEAFRKAAEADAKKAAGKQKSGWSLWPFKKDPNRADLGEKLSLVWDPELKRYVDKSNPSATPAPATSSTPPPPRGLAPPSRAASGSSLAPPPSGTPPPGGAPGMARSVSSGAPPTSHPSTLPGPPVSASGPPSRTGTPAGGPPGGKLLGGPPSRPPTRLSEASSIDDLLGAAGARKGGTVRGKKRGGRYVDVMGANTK
ncbi:hypothetical protein P152DRAFT_516115 [Eremomyces bilateralis CBS 781.70]|uniref:Protein transport protein sec16 n=1 Tax=Eremomyces bilateralis CBS 781.70 TaxID=1392243 RepID=A0A6G1FWX1_9PEZI|nr:uncharacterized protein P152DRAFT_516115 [Eremomyces bilateralis CBS 781.70]KAF1810238.1 hypothetical protein P152DRAFT_516115 [Eremomyces bilateralis CBS 781.70]